MCQWLMRVTFTFFQRSISLTVRFLSDPLSSLGDYEVSNSLQVTSMLSESKHWIVIQLPIAYLATNWPIRV